MEKAVHVFVFDCLADWEIGLVTYDLKTANGKKLHTFSMSAETIVTGGGLRVIPDKTIADIYEDEVSMLILPGGSMWETNDPEPILALVNRLLQKGIPVAAICGATLFLARHGVLDERKHTSNGLAYLQEGAPGYNGEALYEEVPAVFTEGLITASGRYPIEFAHAIVKRLAIYDEQTLDAFLQFWRV
ncbi:glutamine amidotransferase [Brevibacillus fluminis]|uniref:Glutamine amidotransferase n=1 Tax=Brevibacillus fluminis TaxID=511487 RepID=A0A3M8DW19_9BACL|nr:DJ-1/PfpI family protein [Brevibacillus fluminis]RNB92308.1 glutamine amidotransferase [Brevibacillus fluminis]